LTTVIIDEMDDKYENFMKDIDEVIYDFLDCGTDEDPNFFSDFIEYLEDEDYKNLFSNVYFTFLLYASTNDELLKKMVDELYSDKITKENIHIKDISNFIVDEKYRNINEFSKYTNCVSTIVDICDDTGNDDLKNKLYE